MNRFSFKAWDKVRKEWVHEEPCHLIGENILMGGWLDGVSIERYNDIVCLQSTGLQDVNGKEIFEGDVVRQVAHCGWVDHDDDIPHTWVVKADKQYTGFHPFTSCYSDQGSVQCMERDCCCYAFNDQMEIIGNIHENPELLKTKDPA